MRMLIPIVQAATAGAIAAGSLGAKAVRWPPGVSPGISHLLAYTLLGALMALALGRSLSGFLLAFAAPRQGMDPRIMGVINHQSPITNHQSRKDGYAPFFLFMLAG